MKNGGKNKSVVFIILFSIYSPLIKYWNSKDKIALLAV